MDMQSLVDRITKDVVASLKAQESGNARETRSEDSGRFCFSGNVAVVLDEPLSSRQWETLLGEYAGCGVSVLNLSNAAPRPYGGVGEIMVSSEEFERKLPGFQQVVYVAVKRYQISALANMMDNIEGVAAVFAALAASVKVRLADMTGISGCSRMAAFLSDIAKMGVSVKGSCASAPSSAPPCGGKCDGEAGECSGCGKCVALTPSKVGAVVDAGAQRISSSSGNVDRQMASMIDHTLLKPDAKEEDIRKLCAEAREYSFASVCVNPGYVKLASDCLKGSPVKVCTVIGFPLGATTTVSKEMETRDAVANGAEEIDMVINVGALKAGSYDLVQKDIETVVRAAEGRIVKVILETALLTDEEKIIASKLSKQAGADFVKTSTGFGPGGATAKDVALMRQTVGKYMGVKASGGIRDSAIAKEMVDAGATRIGASASVAIVKGEQGKGSY